MKHKQILEQLLLNAKSDHNIIGFLVFGSVATGSHHEKSDIDVITIYRKQKPSSGIKNTVTDGIKVGNIFFTHEILIRSIRTVPYLLHPLGSAKILFDRANMIEPLLKEIKKYFKERPEIENVWSRYYKRLKEEKMKFGYEKTTIIDAWNELEKRYSGGKIKRPFFNSFYLTNPFIFSVIKRFL